MKVYWVTFWYCETSVETVVVYADNKRQCRSLVRNQYGKMARIIEIEEIEIEEIGW